MSESFLHPDRDRNEQQALVRELVEAPALVRRVYAVDSCDGLQPHVMQVLLALGLWPGITVGELAERLWLTRPRTSTAIAVLLDRGLIAVRLQPGDGRRRPYVATEAGAAFGDRFVQRAGDDGSR